MIQMIQITVHRSFDRPSGALRAEAAAAPGSLDPTRRAG
jgi:hypothetical protein